MTSSGLCWNPWHCSTECSISMGGSPRPAIRGFLQNVVSRLCAFRFSSQKSPSSSAHATRASVTTVPNRHHEQSVGGMESVELVFCSAMLGG